MYMYLQSYLHNNPAPSSLIQSLSLELPLVACTVASVEIPPSCIPLSFYSSDVLPPLVTTAHYVVNGPPVLNSSSVNRKPFRRSIVSRLRHVAALKTLQSTV